MHDFDSGSHAQNNREFYDRISSVYDLIADSSEHKARQQGIAALNLQAGESVLEIGFGTGNAILELAAQLGSEGEVCGIDISPGMLAVAQRKVAQQSPSAEINLRVADARDIACSDDRFHAAFCSFTLELFPAEDIPQVLAEIRRVLKPGGRLGMVCMSVVPEGESASALEKSYQWMHQHFPHIVDCRPIDAPRLLTDSQFELIHNQLDSMWTMPVATVVGRVN